MDLIFLGAVSCYPLQSIVPNTGTIGFPLLSGLGIWDRNPILIFNMALFIFVNRKLLRFFIMAKGPEKNTKNKALHTKLLNRKKAKLQEEKKEKALRLKALVTKMNQKKNSDESDNG